MKILNFKLGPFDVNTYVLISEDNKEAIVIDPGDDYNVIKKFIESFNINYILNTHGHFDHIKGNNSIKKYKSSKIVIHKDDAIMLTDPDKNLSSYFNYNIYSDEADIIIENEDFEIPFDNNYIKCVFFPGHTLGSVGYLIKNKNILFSGDFIFEYSIGRTDFPGSNEELMRESLEKIKFLHDDLVVYPGHEEPFKLSDFKNNFFEMNRF